MGLRKRALACICRSTIPHSSLLSFLPSPLSFHFLSFFATIPLSFHILSFFTITLSSVLSFSLVPFITIPLSFFLFFNVLRSLSLYPFFLNHPPLLHNIFPSLSFTSSCFTITLQIYSYLSIFLFLSLSPPPFHFGFGKTFMLHIFFLSESLRDFFFFLLWGFFFFLFLLFLFTNISAVSDTLSPRLLPAWKRTMVPFWNVYSCKA